MSARTRSPLKTTLAPYETSGQGAAPAPQSKVTPGRGGSRSRSRSRGEQEQAASDRMLGLWMLVVLL